MTSKDQCRNLLEKYIKRFAPNPGLLERMGIKWVWERFEQMSEDDCSKMLAEIRMELNEIQRT